jgi:replicative DNA helicase
LATGDGQKYGDNHALETAVISSLIQGDIEPDAVNEFCFEDELYRRIHKAVANGFSDFVTLAKVVGAGIEEIYGLSRFNPISATAFEGAMRLKELAARRRLRELARSWNADPELDISAVQRDLRFLEHQTGTARCESLSDAISAFYKDAAGPPEIPLLTPWEETNRITGGVFPGSLVTIAGRTSSGKSSFALQAAKRLASEGTKTLYVSLEMSSRQLTARVLASESNLRQKDLLRRNISDWDALNKAMDAAIDAGKKLFFSTEGHTVAEVKNLIAVTEPGAVFVDGVNLMRGEGESARIVLQNITRELKRIALTENIAIFILAQLNREAARDAVPTLANLKESGSVEEDSDIVILLSSVWDETDLKKIQNLPAYVLANPCSDEKFREIRKAHNSLVLAQIAKNRDGETGVTQFEFIAPRFKFEELRDGEELPF